MSEYEKSAAECNHANKTYYEADVSEPNVMYEKWQCDDCGATIRDVYQPQHRTIEPRKQDETERHQEELKP